MQPHHESRRIARGLANALAASVDDRTQAREHLARALGGDRRWLSVVQRAVRQRFGAYGGEALARRHAELCEFIASRPAMLDAFGNIQERPRLAGYFTFHARMGAAPLSLGGIALPAFATPADLARWLGLTPEELDWFAGVRVRDG